MEQTTKRILCVDHDHDAAALTTSLFEEMGYEAKAAFTLAEGIGLAKLREFDLIVLDGWYPDGSGLDLCQIIRSFDPITPILLLSRLGYETENEMALGAGAQGYLPKSSIEALPAIVSRVIAGSAAARSVC